MNTIQRGKKNNNRHISSSNGRGRGRGNAPSIQGSVESPHTQASSRIQEELCFTTQVHADAAKSPRGLVHEDLRYSGSKCARGRGRGSRRRGQEQGQGGSNTPPAITNFNNFSDRGRCIPTIFRGIHPSYGGQKCGRGQGISVPTESRFSPRRGRRIGSFSPVTNQRLGSYPTLSESLYAARPLLRPIMFVRSEHTPFLFMHDQEEILKPVAEDIGDDESSHVPTADRVEQIFRNIGGQVSTSTSSEDNDRSEDEEVEEFDFNDLNQSTAFMAHESTSTTITVTSTKAKNMNIDGILQMVEDQVNTNLYQRPRSGTPQLQMGLLETPISTDRHIITNELSITVVDASPQSWKQQLDNSLSFVDTQPDFSSIPSTPESQHAVIPPPSDDEDIIVYPAPHPKVHSISSSGNKHDPKDISHANASGFGRYDPHIGLTIASMPLQDSESTALVGHLDPDPVLAASTPLVQEFFTTGVDVSTNTVQQILTASTTLKNTPSSFILPSAPSALPSSVSMSESTLAPVVVPHPTATSLEKSHLIPFSSLRSSDHDLADIASPRIVKKKKVRKGRKTSFQRMKAKGRKGGLSIHGALVDDARLYDDSKNRRWEEARRGDSDLDWGTSQEGDSDDGLCLEDQVDCNPEDGSKPVSEKGKQKVQSSADDDDHGMVVESEIDVQAMQQFVSGLIGDNAGVFITMEDADVEKKSGEEVARVISSTVSTGDNNDADDVGGVADGKEEIEEILKLEERLLIGESSDDELDFSPKSSFQMRLERLRAQARIANAHNEDDEDDTSEKHLVWAEEDGDEYEDDDNHLISQNIYDTDVESFQSRKQRNRYFNSIQNSNFDIDTAGIQPARKRNDKYEDLSPELLGQWELDRKRKAEYKHERELKKLIAATDPFIKKKGGKKGRKVMRKATTIDPAAIDLAPNRIIDITTLIQQIRRFITNLDGPSTMSLPPANKQTRKKIHELAVAFGLKSLSKGKGNARYTTLTKTSRTGVARVDELKIRKVTSRSGGQYVIGDSFNKSRCERGKGNRVPKHREGDQVGASAQKIGQGNLGFKMLAAMGWSEGDKIGLSGGLDAPLVAIIKHTKLGLGATK